MIKGRTEYLRKTRNLCTHLDREVYKILSQEPGKEWELFEIQDSLEQNWGVRPYKATLLRHAFTFYQEHHIPLFYRAGFSSDKYKLNESIETGEWQEFFMPKPKGRPRKYSQKCKTVKKEK